MDEQLVSRRGTLKYLGLLAGTEAGKAFLSEWLPGGAKLLATPGACQGEEPERSRSAGGLNQLTTYLPRFFKPEEFETVGILAEMIIPTDETPGAREAQVANYIDFITSSAAEFKPELQREWIEGLKLLDDLSRREHGQTFREISFPQREALLAEMSLPERDPQADHPGFRFYRLVKEMTVEGFYTSRTGLMDVLEYKGLTYLSSFSGCTHPEHH
jgi:hypothetical protein